MTRWQPVVCLGAKARRVLASGSGRILAASTNAIYLLSNGGQMTWLTTEHAPMHRRGLRVAGCLPQTAVGSAYAASGARLWGEAGLALDWAGAATWHPPDPCRKNRATLADLGHHLSTLASVIDALPTPRGFGVLLPSILGSVLEGSERRRSLADSPAVEVALPPIRRIARACWGRDFSGALGRAEALIGLGEGLTPSGDDFVGGLLFGLVTIQAVHAPFRDFSLSKVRRFLRRAHERTNLLSLTFLRDHAAGQGSEVLHRLAGSLIAGQSSETVGRLGRELVAIGHSTGWDLLTGLWTALLMVATGATHSGWRARAQAGLSRGT
jgi:hypothetical protein